MEFVTHFTQKKFPKKYGANLDFLFWEEDIFYLHVSLTYFYSHMYTHVFFLFFSALVDQEIKHQKPIKS